MLFTEMTGSGEGTKAGELRSQESDSRAIRPLSVVCVAFGIIVLRRLITGLAFPNQRCNIFRPVTTELKP